MQRQPIAVGEPSPGGVRGLGVCDVLEVELAPIQVPWLIDELDEMRGPLEEELRLMPPAASDERDAKEYEVRLLRSMRAGLPSRATDEPVRFVGPSGMVERAVRGTMRNVASALSDLASARTIDVAAVRDTADAAARWAATLAGCTDVLGFNFDPQAEPQQSW